MLGCRGVRSVSKLGSVQWGQKGGQEDIEFTYSSCISFRNIFLMESRIIMIELQGLACVINDKVIAL